MIWAWGGQRSSVAVLDRVTEALANRWNRCMELGMGVLILPEVQNWSTPANRLCRWRKRWSSETLDSPWHFQWQPAIQIHRRPQAIGMLEQQLRGSIDMICSPANFVALQLYISPTGECMVCIAVCSNSLETCVYLLCRQRKYHADAAVTGSVP